MTTLTFFSGRRLYAFAAVLFLASVHFTVSFGQTPVASPAVQLETDRARLTQLRAEIAHHDALYFQKAAPEISDAAYDQLKREVTAIETAHPQLVTPAALTDDRSGLFQSYRHRERMLSLDKAYTETEVRTFYAHVAKRLARPDVSYVIEPKVDGLAVSVTYDHGKLVRAATRGDGLEGDDITAHARFVHNLPITLLGPPSSIPDSIELRGELYVPLADFKRVNQEREAAGETPFANPRNLAAGTVRQLDSAAVSERGLTVIFYGFAASAPAIAAPRTQQALHAKLRGWALPAFASVETARSADELWQAVKRIGLARTELPFPTDGAVIKVDEVAAQRELGASDTAPHWALAYKFTPEQIETRLRAITIQVGRTGVLTPVAELEPVAIAGSKVSRATLHNRDEIARKDIRIGDTVRLEKAGEIIPAISDVNLALRPADSIRYVFPTTCPACRTPLANVASEVAVRCPNYDCPAQVRRRLEFFASKSGIGIEGLGPALIGALVETGKLHTVADLYRLEAADFHLPERKAGAVGDKIAAALVRSKSVELWRFIRALGIADIGDSTARELGRRFGTLSALAAATPEDLSAFSEHASAALLAHFESPENRRVIAELIAVGVDPQPER